MKKVLSEFYFVLQVVLAGIFIDLPMFIGRVIRRLWIKLQISRQNKHFSRTKSIKELQDFCYQLIKDKKYTPYKWAALGRNYDRPEEIFVLYDTNYKRLVGESFNPANSYFHNVNLSRLIELLTPLTIEELDAYQVQWHLTKYALTSNLEEFKMCVEFLTTRFQYCAYRFYERLLEFNDDLTDYSLKEKKLELLLKHYKFDMAQTPEDVGGDNYDYLQEYDGCDKPKSRLLLILLYIPRNPVAPELKQNYLAYQEKVLPQILEYWSEAELVEFKSNLIKNLYNGHTDLNKDLLNCLLDMKCSLAQKALLDKTLPNVETTTLASHTHTKTKLHKI